MNISMYSASVPAALRVSDWCGGSPFSAAAHDTVAWIAGDSIVRGVFFMGATVALFSLLEGSKKRDFKTVKASELPTVFDILGSKEHQSQMSLKSWSLYVATGICLVAAAIFTGIGIFFGSAGLLGSVYVLTKDFLLAEGVSENNSRLMGIAGMFLTFQVGAAVVMNLRFPGRPVQI